MKWGLGNEDINFKLRYISHGMTKPTKWQGTQEWVRSAWVSVHSDQSSLWAQPFAKDPRFLHADSEDWSDLADAKADLGLHWVHMYRCCHAAAHI